MLISRVHGLDRPSIRKILRPDGTEVKKVLPDGREVSPIDWPTHWWGSQRDVTIREVASLYQDIQPHECLVLGGALHGRVVTNLPRTEFKLPPANLMVVDVDGMPYVEGYSDATLRADPENTIRAQLVAMFTERVVGKVHIVVALSSRAGFTGDFRAHVWIGLVENYAAKDVAAWQRSRPVEWIDIPRMAAKVERLRQQLSPTKFRQEVLVEMLSDGVSYFDLDLIEKATSEEMAICPKF